MRALHKLVLICVALSGVVVSVFAQVPEPTDVVGEANRWTTHGGSPSRSGATRTKGPRGSVEIAWSRDAEGVIEGEPLVWDDAVVITFARGGDVRVLRVLDLFSGEPVVSDRIVRSTQPLEPSLWRNVIVYRSAPNQIAAVRIGNTRLSEVWSTRTEGECGPPLIVGDDIWVAATKELACFKLGRRTPSWKQDGCNFFGRVALAGGVVYATSSKPDACGLAAFQANSGQLCANVFRFPISAGPNASIALMRDAAFVDFGVKLPGPLEFELRIAGVDFNDLRVESFHPVRGSIGMLTLPTALGSGWIARLINGEGGPLLVRVESLYAKTMVELASRKHHSEFVDDTLPVAIAGSVAYVGARAFGAESDRLLWRLPLKATQRAVPARESVLIVDGGKRLVAVRSRAPKAIAEMPSSAGASEVQGTLVTRDGSVESGAFVVDASAKRVRRPAEKTSDEWKLDDVLLLEDGAQQVICGHDPLRGIELLNEKRVADSLLELLKKARSTNDAELLDELASAAALRGADAKQVESAQKAADDLRARKSPATVRKEPAAELRARANELEGRHARLLLEHLAALSGELRPTLDTKLLRAALTLEPKNAAALESVRALLPETLRPKAEFDALDSLAFVEATRRAPVTFVAAPQKNTPGLSYVQVQIGQRLSTWRKDLYGVQSANLLIITPVRRFGALARCVATGELVCQMLGELLANGAAPREESRPMVIELYESRKEYLELSGHGRGQSGEFGADLGWSAGHYDRRDNVSRFYFPDDEAEFEGALATAAHELTHHWLSARCPLWPFRPISAGDFEQPGYWVVEGFASFIDEFDFDLDRGAWSLGGANSRRLDLVVSAGVNQHLPWSMQLGLSHQDFGQLPREIELGVPLSQRLGTIGRAGLHHLFYAQAAATARYLWEADGGALRPKLIEFLRAYYSGEHGQLDLSKALGVEAAELAKRVTEHARKVVAGQ